MSSDHLGALVSTAIGTAAKKLRSLLGDDYGRYESTLHALDVVDAQLLALPLDGRHDVDLAGDGAEWIMRLDQATNALEDLVQDMEEEAAAAATVTVTALRWWWWWWRPVPVPLPHDAVGTWLGSDHENMTRMEVAVGRLASIYLEGGALFGTTMLPII